MVDQTAAIKKLWPGCKVYDSEGKITGVYIPGDFITYDKLFALSSIVGHNDIDIEHESGGSYSEITPDLRPGNFSLWLTRNQKDTGYAW